MSRIEGLSFIGLPPEPTAPSETGVVQLQHSEHGPTSDSHRPIHETQAGVQNGSDEDVHMNIGEALHSSETTSTEAVGKGHSSIRLSTMAKERGGTQTHLQQPGTRALEIRSPAEWRLWQQDEKYWQSWASERLPQVFSQLIPDHQEIHMVSSSSQEARR